MTHALDDTTLMAYADGHLPPEDQLAVEDLLRRDAAARRLVLWFHMSALCLREAFADRAFEQVPAHLIDSVNPTYGSQPVRRLERLQSSWKRLMALSLFMPMAAMTAASAVVIVGSTATHWPRPAQATIELGLLSASNPLAAHLERQQNIQFTPSSGGQSRFVVGQSFRDKFGRSCHDVMAFPSEASTIPSELLIACRAGGNSWAVVGAVATTSPGTHAYIQSPEAAGGVLASVWAMMGAKAESGTHGDGSQAQ